MTDQPTTDDIWKAWLLDKRFRGDAELMQRVLVDFLYPIRDRVLDNAVLREGEMLLDVGCGDGLIGFGALARTQAGRVIFSDISRPLLDHAEDLAAQMGVAARCDFLEAPADDLSALADASVDVVTTRSVLIFVDDKSSAFEEFRRVLRPGGRISLFEPINRFGHPEPRERFIGYDVTPVMDLSDRVKAVFDALQPADTDPMVNFDERDLVRLAEQAGFGEIRLELEVKVRRPLEERTWDNLLHVPGNPKIPSLAEAVEQALTPEEGERFLAHLRPFVEARQGVERSAVAYMRAVKD